MLSGIFEKGIHLIKKHGPNVFLWGLLNENILILGDTKLVEKVLLAKQTQKSLLYTFLNSWLRTGLLLSSGEKWFQRRRIITPTFHFKILEQFVTVFNREAETMVDLMRKHVGGKEFDVYSYVTLMALDSVCGRVSGKIQEMVVFITDNNVPSRNFNGNDGECSARSRQSLRAERETVNLNNLG